MIVQIGSCHSLLFSVLMLIFINSQAATFTVDTEFDQVDNNIGNGLCETAELNCSLRAAIQESNVFDDRDKIVLGAGTFQLNLLGIDENLSATGDLDIFTAVDIEGVSPELTFIDGNNTDRVFEMISKINYESVKLSHLTIQNGNYSEWGNAAGSAILTTGQDIELLDVHISNNTTDSRGATAVHIEDACVTGNQIRITENVGLKSRSGTIYIIGDTACLELNEFEISNNESDRAAAIYLETSTAQMHLNQGLIAYNKSRASVIIINANNQHILENVTVSSNESNGAILNDGGSNLIIKNSTITKNIGFNGQTPIVGGIQDVHGLTGLTYLTNSIVANNGPGFLSDDIERGNSLHGGNILGDVSMYSSNPSDFLSFDPMLGPLENLGGYAAAHKPNVITADLAIDDYCSEVDQLNQPRPQDGDRDGISRCDAGSVELVVDLVFKTGFESKSTLN